MRADSLEGEPKAGTCCEVEGRVEVPVVQASAQAGTWVSARRRELQRDARRHPDGDAARSLCLRAQPDRYTDSGVERDGARRGLPAYPHPSRHRLPLSSTASLVSIVRTPTPPASRLAQASINVDKHAIAFCLRKSSGNHSRKLGKDRRVARDALCAEDDRMPGWSKAEPKSGGPMPTTTVGPRREGPINGGHAEGPLRPSERERRGHLDACPSRPERCFRATGRALSQEVEGSARLGLYVLERNTAILAFGCELVAEETVDKALRRAHRRS